MKKYLSIIALAGCLFSEICAAPFPNDATRAEGDEQTFDFTLAYDYYTSLQNSSFKRGSDVYQAFEFDAGNATRFAGSRITSVNITSGTYKNTNTNTVKNITIFLADDLNSEPFYTQSAKLGDEGATMYHIDLNTPYNIEAGKGIVVGYYFKLTSEDVNYISVDGVYHENHAGGWIGNKLAGQDVVWMNISETYGNLCMGCGITGTNFPTDGVTLLSLDGPEYAQPNENFPYTIYFQNTASNNVTSMEISYKVGNENKITETVNLSQPLGYNQRKGLKFNNLKHSQPGVDIPVVFEISKVNGSDNTAAETSRIGFLNCFSRDAGFRRVHLLEEGTGTWCQWCPSGMVMMERIKNLYPEDYALVAVHSNDVMQVPSTSEVIGLFSGYPTALFDRSTAMYPQNANINALLEQYTAYYSDIPSILGITTLSAAKNEDDKLNVTTGVTFALDIPAPERYRLSYYITESGVGPYPQNNAGYSGGTVPMGGWEDKPLEVSILFDDVARLLQGGLSGLENSLPENIEQGKEYRYDVELPLNRVNKDKINLIAFVVDMADGSVVNVSQKEIDLTENSVEEINTLPYSIHVGQGKLYIAGSFQVASVTSLSGINIGALTEEGELTLPKGIYIVVVDGKSHKVAI